MTVLTAEKTQAIELVIDVTSAAQLGEEAHIAVTVTLPPRELLLANPLVCFGKPGGGYSKEYYTVDLPGPAQGAQADWHASRGWIFVSVDHLGVGRSSTHHSADVLDYSHLSATASAAEAEVLERLAAGTLAEGFPPITNPVTIGIGQSMGGCMTVVQQGRYNSYDGIGVLGYSAVHTNPPPRPGHEGLTVPWMPRDVKPTIWADRAAGANPGVVNKSQLATAAVTNAHDEAGESMAWGFHFDDVDKDLIAMDLASFPLRSGNVPPWASTTLPVTVAVWCVVPGAIAPEAAAVTVPVLVAMGERDVIADPKGEPRAYQSATSVDLYRCPRMAHMHNFASTRELFWQRIETWAEWVRTQKLSSA